MQNIATVIAGLIIAFTANWILALIILGVAPIMFAQGYFQGKFMKGFSGDAKVCLRDIFSHLFSFEIYGVWYSFSSQGSHWPQSLSPLIRVLIYRHPTLPRVQTLIIAYMRVIY